LRGFRAAVPDSFVIAIDAMGGDHGPAVVVPGVALAAERTDAGGVRFSLHGDRGGIETELRRLPALRDRCDIRHTDRVILTEEKPGHAMRHGAGSSLWNAIDQVRLGEARAAVSSGNTGALMAIARLHLRMLGGLKRPALVGMWPTLRGVSTVLDVGANVRCDAERLIEFAIMGEAFHRTLHHVERPTVGLLSNGREEQKGHDEVREADRLLREGAAALNYQGFVEGDDIGRGVVDVVVTDGFTGNVALKTAEGTGRYVLAEMRAAFAATPLDRLGALIASRGFRRLKTRLDPRTLNGSPLVGLNGMVVKSHGGTDASGFATAIGVAINLARSNYVSEIQENLQQLTAALAEVIPSATVASENSA
jgi:glycerol-3-phosphate acyltransferase PlsX